MFAKFEKILLFALVFLLAVACTPAAFSQEDNPDVTSKMISPSENAAGLIFLATPDTETYAAQQQVAAENGLIWADKISKIEGSKSELFSEGVNQLSGDSGFTFAVQTTGETGGKVAALGLNAFFYFTPENLGQEKYNLLRTQLEAESVYEGWVRPNPSALRDLGLSVRVLYPGGGERDITSLMSFGINIEEKDSGRILLSYGAVIVDRAVTDNEGQELFLSDENEVLLSDGEQDNIVAGTWWIAMDDVSAGSKSSGGCSAGAFGALATLAGAMTLITRNRRI
jgi:hypothetical protein